MSQARLTSGRWLGALAVVAMLVAGSACTAPAQPAAGASPRPAPGGTTAPESAQPSPGATGSPASNAASPPASNAATPPASNAVSPPASTPPSGTPRPATPSTSAAPKPAPKPTQTPAEPAALLARGASGERVRNLQHRLRQLEWFSGSITGRYEATTAAGVEGFQDKRGLRPTGAVDQRTWDRLRAMTERPTADELHNVLRPGPAMLERGSTGDRVRGLQARLKQIGWFAPLVTDRYGPTTVAAVRGFQAKREIPVTGEVDQRTWERLVAMTRAPTRDEKHNVVPKPSAAGLDPRCLTGRAMCVSKRTNSLVWVVDGQAQLRVDVRFGSQELPTRNGAFQVRWKSRDHVSSLYHTPMPYAMFFSGGQAVHYSPDFAARGYSGASHGCVNVRNRTAIAGLFNTVRVGDKVIVHG